MAWREHDQQHRFAMSIPSNSGFTYDLAIVCLKTHLPMIVYQGLSMTQFQVADPWQGH